MLIRTDRDRGAVVETSLRARRIERRRPDIEGKGKEAGWGHGLRGRRREDDRLHQNRNKRDRARHGGDVAEGAERAAGIGRKIRAAGRMAVQEVDAACEQNERNAQQTDQAPKSPGAVSARLCCVVQSVPREKRLGVTDIDVCRMRKDSGRVWNSPGRGAAGAMLTQAGSQ